MEDKEWPDLSQMEARLVDQAREYSCNFTKQRFNSDKTAVYLS